MTTIDPLAGLIIIDVGGTISGDHIDCQNKLDQLELMQAMIEQQRDPGVFEWVQAVHLEQTHDPR